jgi:hypothetical protein
MTTRLSNSAKGVALGELRSLLNNVVGFVACPITDRSQLVELWNSKSPPDLVEAARTLGVYNMGVGSGSLSTDLLRWCTEIDGKLHSAYVNLDEIGIVSQEKMKQGVVQYALGFIALLRQRGYYRECYLDIPADHEMVLSTTYHKHFCLEITPDDMRKFLGADLTDEVLQWMHDCANMREELILANTSLQSIFDMAATAGQIKRMVPELLQYLPARQRAAFEEQKRSSTVPFEWAPFPKKNVDVMLTQINKGHLLQNMRKPERANCTIETIDHVTWARSDVRWAK